jgi:hypothetical protein
LFCMSVFVPVPCCFCFIALLYNLKSGIVIPLAMLFLLRITLTVQGLLHELKDCFFYFCEECH